MELTFRDQQGEQMQPCRMCDGRGGGRGCHGHRAWHRVRMFSVFCVWHFPARSLATCESLFLNRHRETLTPLGLFGGGEAMDYEDQVRLYVEKSDPDPVTCFRTPHPGS